MQIGVRPLDSWHGHELAASNTGHFFFFDILLPLYRDLFLLDMKIPPEYAEFSFYSVYSRGSISC